MSPSMLLVVSSWATFVVLLIGALSGVWQVSRVAQQARSEYMWKRRENALSYSLTRSEIHFNARLELERVFGDKLSSNTPLTLEEIDEKEKEDNGVSVLTNIRVLLAHWENMALAIYAHIADEDVAFEMVAGTVVKTVATYREYIDRERRKNPKSFQYLVMLNDRWSKIRSGPQVIFSDPGGKDQDNKNIDLDNIAT